MNQRPARISGWVQIAGRKRPVNFMPEIGGMVDVSRTGAKLYLSWKVTVGDIIPLVLKLPQTGGNAPMPGRVIRVIKDAPGNMDNFEARMKLLSDMVRNGLSKGGIYYGYAAGIRWDPTVSKECIRAIQMHFEEENTRPVKRVFLTRTPDLDRSATPASLRSNT